MDEYQKNISNQELLYVIFTKMNIKLNTVLDLMDKKRTYLETKELFEIKSKMIEVFNLLILNIDNERLINTYLYLSHKLSLTKKEDIQIVIDFCIKSKQIEEKEEKKVI